MYSIVGVNEQNTIFKKASLDDLFGEEYVTTDTYLAGEYIVYVYLLDDDEITLDTLNYSLLSSKVSEWIPYGFVFYYSKI